MSTTERIRFSEFVKANTGLVYHQLLRLSGGDAALAEDLCQEVFSKVWRKREQYADYDCKHKRWLVSIAVRTFLDHRRGAMQAALRDAAPYTEVAARGMDAERSLMAERVRQIILGLPEQQKRVVVLWFYEGYTLAEIAAELDISVNTAKSRWRYAKEKLARGMRKHRSELSAAEDAVEVRVTSISIEQRMAMATTALMVFILLSGGEK